MRRKGFTLLEILVVITIMVLMAALALASFNKFLSTERIRLAGGQVESSLRMARQYAMSKRTKCVVEFVTPGEETRTELSNSLPCESAKLRSGSYCNSAQGAGGRLRYVTTTDNDDWRTALKVDLASLDGIVTRATLRFNLTRANAADCFTVEVKQMGDDWSVATVTWNIAQGLAQSPFAQFTADHNGLYEVDVTGYICDELIKDKTASMLLAPIQTSAGAASLGAFTVEVEYYQSTFATGKDIDPRQIRVLPCRRVVDPYTGGMRWLVEPDANALQVTELPSNVHFALVPGRKVIRQYDPAMSFFQFTPAPKTFIMIEPDGSCSAEAPEAKDEPLGTEEHWKTTLNTVILVDMATEETAMIYANPVTTGTKVRYLSGKDIEEFKTAHDPYLLW